MKRQARETRVGSRQPPAPRLIVTMPTPDSRLPMLDYCRFVAAVSVVSFHYFWNGIANHKIATLDHVEALGSWARFGYLGVDLFFMISGYVIFMSARRRTTAQFIVSRATRLYPAYLVAMLTTAAIACWLGSGDTSVTLGQVLGNVLFYQPLHHQKFVDGVYWTLMFETRFYIAVAVLIAIGAQRYFDTVFKAWPILMLAVFLFGKGAWGDPARGDFSILGGYYAFFASGALFAIVRERASWSGYAALAVSTALGIRYAAAVAAVNATPSELAITIAVLCSFSALFFVINWSAEGRVATLPAATFLGALTYPLYLVHAHIGYMLLSRFASPEHRVLSYAGTIAFVVFLAWLIHEIIEVRSGPVWRAGFESVVSTLERPFKRLAELRLDQKRRRREHEQSRLPL